MMWLIMSNFPDIFVTSQKRDRMRGQSSNSVSVRDIRSTDRVRALVTNSFTVTAVIARNFATRDGTMRASNAILAFGLLVASAATVTATHNAGGAHSDSGITLNGASPSRNSTFRRHPEFPPIFQTRTTPRSDALRVPPRGVRVVPRLALGAGLLQRRDVTAAVRRDAVPPDRLFFSRCERENDALRVSIKK